MTWQRRRESGAIGWVWLFVTVCATWSAGSEFENWPGWRGPRGDGTSREANVPTHWNGLTGENIAWKTEVPGIGHASPIVWEDHIFTVSCLTESLERVLLCFDRQSGELRWQQTVIRSPLERKHHLNSHASGTPATDGERVYVAFLDVSEQRFGPEDDPRRRGVPIGRMVVAAFDFAGNRHWQVEAGDFSSVHGFRSDPVLFEDLVIVNGDHDGESYLVALDRATGETVWEVARWHQTRSYVTPLIREIDGRAQMVLSGSQHIASYDPRTGDMHWWIEGPTQQFVASLVYDGQLFYMTAGFPTYHVMGIRPDGSGDVTDSHVQWHSTQARCYVPSPVVIAGRLLVTDDRGTVNCFRARDGERLWRERLARGYSASAVTADGRAYLVADEGVTTVLRPADRLEILAENPLGENVYASPAISQGQIYLRGERHLYSIGPQP